MCLTVTTGLQRNTKYSEMARLFRDFGLRTISVYLLGFRFKLDKGFIGASVEYSQTSSTEHTPSFGHLIVLPKFFSPDTLAAKMS